MNRYQIYLDPKTVNGLDELSSGLDMSRSQLIRDVVSRVMREFEKVLYSTEKIRSKSDPLLKMIGLGKSSTGRIARDADSIYLKD